MILRNMQGKVQIQITFLKRKWRRIKSYWVVWWNRTKNDYIQLWMSHKKNKELLKMQQNRRNWTRNGKCLVHFCVKRACEPLRKRTYLWRNDQRTYFFLCILQIPISELVSREKKAYFFYFSSQAKWICETILELLEFIWWVSLSKQKLFQE